MRQIQNQTRPGYQLVQKLKLGQFIYYLYHAPKAFIRKYLKRGVVESFVDAQAQREMERSAYRLKAITFESTQSALDIHFLTGKNFWYQTCYCAYSMMQYSKVPLRPVIYDDGSLEKFYQDEIYRIFPNAKIILKSELDDRVQTHLPISRFPYLNERRQNYPNLRKLIDVHIGSQGWKLVLDSDMLFFQKPHLLIDWLQSPQQPCHMVDVETSYGYSHNLMAALAQTEIPERLNVGICGLKSESLDWGKLEYWCQALIDQEGTHYYLEQALIAMLMAKESCSIAPSMTYIVMPDRAEVIQPTAVLHHYVADSKPWYFRYAWKQISQDSLPLRSLHSSL